MSRREPRPRRRVPTHLGYPQSLIPGKETRFRSRAEGGEWAGSGAQEPFYCLTCQELCPDDRDELIAFLLVKVDRLPVEIEELAAPLDSGVGVSVLLRQPRSFEGLVPASEVFRSHNSPVPHGVADGLRTLNLNPVASLGAKAKEHDHLLATVNDLLDIKDDLLPACAELLPELRDAIVSVIGRFEAGKSAGCMPLHLGMERFQPGIKVASVPRYKGGSHDLHILLRHRRRSIPQAQESA